MPEPPEERCQANTDRELWREKEGDYYAPSVFVTEGGGIGMQVGGNVVVKPIRDWHALVWHDAPPQPNNNNPLRRTNTMDRKLDDWITEQWCAIAKKEDVVALHRISLFAKHMINQGYVEGIRAAEALIGRVIPEDGKRVE